MLHVWSSIDERRVDEREGRWRVIRTLEAALRDMDRKEEEQKQKRTKWGPLASSSF